MRKKVYALILIISMLPLMTAYATANIITPQFTYIMSISAGLDINKYGRAQCVGSVDATSDNYRVTLTVTLEKYVNNGWRSIKSWSGSGSGQSGLIVEGYYYIDHGLYMVCSTARVYNSSGTLLETESLCSAKRLY